MKNTLTDLNNYLFEAIERLNDDELDEAALEKEIKRSEAVQKIASTIIANGQLVLHAKKHMDDYGQGGNIEMPMLGVTNENLHEENAKLRETVTNLQARVKKQEGW